MRSSVVIAACLAVSACATAPKPLQGQFSTLLPTEAASRQAAGEIVRWGGRIVSVEPEAQRSCFEIVASPLTESGRPRKVDNSSGRFIACRAGYYEPEVFSRGRELTIAGRIEGFELRKVGGYDYQYPRVAADVIYLWPEHDERGYYPYHYADPFYFRGGYGRRW